MGMSPANEHCPEAAPARGGRPTTTTSEQSTIAGEVQRRNNNRRDEVAAVAVYIKKQLGAFNARYRAAICVRPQYQRG
jgi:hypothetical protein